MNIQRLCRARLEISQLQHVRRMWVKLQKRIRYLYVTIRVERLGNNDRAQSSASRQASNYLFSLRFSIHQCRIDKVK